MWCSDIVIAASDLNVVTAFSRLGVSGDGGSSWYLPRLVGPRRAQQLMLESRPLNAQQALDWGLVTRAVEPDALATEARTTVERLATRPTLCLGQQRRLLFHAGQRTLKQGLDAELDAMRMTGASGDAAEGMSAFVQRRRPVFTAR